MTNSAQSIEEVIEKLTAIIDWAKEEQSRLGSVEDAIINFSMSKARDAAWRVSERLAPLTPDEQAPEIEALDRDVAEFARVIRHPGFVETVITKVVRLGERGTVSKIFEGSE